MIDLSRFEVLTFDCYGTLIDWEKGILGAVKPVLARHGVGASDDAILETYAALEAKYEEGDYLPYRMVLRLVMTEMSLRFKFDADPGELDCLARSIGDWAPFPDTVDALRRLAKKYRLGVISNVDDALFAATAKGLRVAVRLGHDGAASARVQAFARDVRGGAPADRPAAGPRPARGAECLPRHRPRQIARARLRVGQPEGREKRAGRHAARLGGAGSRSPRSRGAREHDRVLIGFRAGRRPFVPTLGRRPARNPR